jgi:hypothetical protein
MCFEMGSPFRRENEPDYYWSLPRCWGVTILSLTLTQNQKYFATGGLPPIRSSWRQAPSDPQQVFFN